MPENADVVYEHCDGSPVRYVWIVFDEDEIYGVYATEEAAANAAGEVGNGYGEYERAEVRNG